MCYRTAALALALLLSGWMLPAPPTTADESGEESVVRIGAKAFTESYILAEIVAQLLESRGHVVERQLSLGGTLIAFEALQTDSIDIYPEYTGTLTQAILHQPDLNTEQLTAALKARGLVMQVPLGFNNSYAIAIDASVAHKLGIKRISDLREHPDLPMALSLEYLKRGDGWPALKTTYQLPQQPTGIEHALAYPAIERGKLAITDAYTTDGELDRYDLRLLEDDLQFFPQYDAVLLARDDLDPEIATELAVLSGLIDDSRMRALNRSVSDGELSSAQAAAGFLQRERLAAPASVPVESNQRILRNIGIHLKLTGIALLLACAIAIPLALVLTRYGNIARFFLYVCGLLQTIPALALLALLIPLVGLGETPAIIALFLYSLLPIVRNTLTGIFNVDPLLKQVAIGMGLTPNQQLQKVELPLAIPMILAGVKTAAIISIGTATLAAFVGAGGLGEPIITGLTLNDHRLILEGAIPAAILAIAVELLFEAVERATVPAHLRQ